MSPSSKRHRKVAVIAGKAVGAKDGESGSTPQRKTERDSSPVIGNKRLRKVAENEARKDFTRSEAVAIAKLIEERERPKAEARKAMGNVLGAALGGRGERDGLLALESRSSKLTNEERRLNKVAVIAGKAVG